MMSSAVDNQSDKRKATRDALLDAITDEVQKIDPHDSQHIRITVLKTLAEAYSLIYHGSETPKS
jgi:hypothetical protein